MSEAFDPTEPDAVALDLLHSLKVYPQVRERLHGLLALYAHTPRHRRMGPHLDGLESLLMELAAELAEELLDAGWRPGPA